MGKAEELATAVAGLERAKGKRRKYPLELRERLIAFVREQRSAGIQLKSIADRVGVSATLLHRWDVTRVAKFRRVELRPPGVTSRLVLHAPHAVRVEGLGIDELVAILQRLG